MVRNNIFHRLLNCFQSHSLRQKLAQDCCYSVFVNATKRMKFPFKGFFCIFRPVHTCYENFVFCFAKNCQSFRSNSLEMFFIVPICKTSRTSCDLAIKLVVYSNFHYYNKIVLSVISVFFQNTGEKYRLKSFVSIRNFVCRLFQRDKWIRGSLNNRPESFISTANVVKYRTKLLDHMWIFFIQWFY